MNLPTWQEALDAFIKYLETGGSRTGRPISKAYKDQLIFKIRAFYSTPQERAETIQNTKQANKTRKAVAYGAIWLDARNNREILLNAIKDRENCDANKWIRYLKQFWSFCGMLDDDGDGLNLDAYRVNPAQGKRFRMRKEKSKHGLVTDSENIKVLSHFRKTYDANKNFINLRNLVMFGLLYHSGCRPCELVTITRQSINKVSLKQGMIIIDEVKVKDSDDRVILLPPQKTPEREELEKYLKFYDAMFPESAELFLSERGKPLKAGVLQNHIKPLRKKLKLRSDYSVYATRHNKASQLVRAGVNPVATQKIMGHKSLDTTTRYVHLHGQDLVSINNAVYERQTEKPQKSPREIFKEMQEKGA